MRYLSSRLIRLLGRDLRTRGNHELNPPELRPVRVQGLGGGSPIAGQTSRWEGVRGLLRGLPLMSLALFAGTLVQYSA